MAAARQKKKHVERSFAQEITNIFQSESNIKKQHTQNSKSQRHQTQEEKQRVVQYGEMPVQSPTFRQQQQQRRLHGKQNEYDQQNIAPQEEYNTMRRVQSVHLKKQISQPGWNQVSSNSRPGTEFTSRTSDNPYQNHPGQHPYQSQQQPSRLYKMKEAPIPPCYQSAQHIQPLHQKLQEIVGRSALSMADEPDLNSYAPQNFVSYQSISQLPQKVNKKPDILTVDWSRKGLTQMPTDRDIFHQVGFHPIKLQLNGNQINQLTSILLAKNILSLNLQDNQLERVDLSIISQGAKRIRELNLSHNRIAKIIGHQDLQFSSLRKLELGYNMLSDSYMMELFQTSSFSKLKQLGISNNRLQSVDVIHAILMTLTHSLRSLNASNNQIKGHLTMQSSTKLRDLTLNGNKIDSLMVLAQQHYIKKIDISQNELKFIGSEQTKMLPRLLELQLRGNSLQDSGMIQFFIDNSTRLKYLDMGDNNITSLQILSRTVEVLHLDGNTQLRLSEISKMQLPKLKQLNLPHHNLLNPRTLSSLHTVFPQLIQLNGQSIDIENTQKPPHHMRSISQGQLPYHNSQSQQLSYPCQKSTTLEFSLTQQCQDKGISSIQHQNENKVRHSSIGEGVISSTTEEIFNSQVVRLGSSNGKQSTHARRSSVPGDFISKRISHRSYIGSSCGMVEPSDYAQPVLKEENQPQKQSQDRVEIGPNTSRERVISLETLQLQLTQIASQYQNRDSKVTETSKQILDLFNCALEQVKSRLLLQTQVKPKHVKQSQSVISFNQPQSDNTPNIKVSPRPFSSSRKPFIDYEHLLTLLSTPLSLLLQTLTKRKESTPQNTQGLIKELCRAMVLPVSSFNLGKYLFQRKDEADMIDQILAAYHPLQTDHSSHQRRSSLSSLPPLDTFILKSQLLKDVLENEVNSEKYRRANSGQPIHYSSSTARDQWDIVKELREKILNRIEELEKPGDRGGASLIEEFKNIQVNLKQKDLLMKSKEGSVQYLDTTEEADSKKAASEIVQKESFIMSQVYLVSQDKSEKSLTRHIGSGTLGSTQNYAKAHARSRSSASSSAGRIMVAPPKQAEVENKEKIELALKELLLYARHPLRQITIDQAAMTFLHDVTPSKELKFEDTSQNAYNEGKLIKFLLSAINSSLYRLIRVMKAYNYERIQQTQSVSSNLTLMFARVYGKQVDKQITYLKDQLLDSCILMSSSLASLEALQPDTSLVHECLVIMIPEDEVLKGVMNTDDYLTTNEQLLAIQSDDQLTYFEKLGVYLIKSSSRVQHMAVYHLEYELK